MGEHFGMGIEVNRIKPRRLYCGKHSTQKQARYILKLGILQSQILGILKQFEPPCNENRSTIPFVNHILNLEILTICFPLFHHVSFSHSYLRLTLGIFWWISGDIISYFIFRREWEKHGISINIGSFNWLKLHIKYYHSSKKTIQLFNLNNIRWVKEVWLSSISIISVGVWENIYCVIAHQLAKDFTIVWQLFSPSSV